MPGEVRAESPGTAYNVSGSTLLLTPVSPALAGVTVTAASDWIAPSGTPEESDASLRARCRLRWSTLGRGATLEAYQYNALTAGVAAITRGHLTGRQAQLGIDVGRHARSPGLSLIHISEPPRPY